MSIMAIGDMSAFVKDIIAACPVCVAGDVLVNGGQDTNIAKAPIIGTAITDLNAPSSATAAQQQQVQAQGVSDLLFAALVLGLGGYGIYTLMKGRRPSRRR